MTTESISNRGVHRFAVFTAACTFLLLIAGALVTSNDAGLAVPDWPLSYGSLLPPMVGGIFWEHGHRMVAGFVGILTICLAVWLWRVEPRPWVRKLGFAALGLVIAQAILGGITVRFYLPPPVSAAHATLAQLFFVAVISIALFTGNWWQAGQPQAEDSGSPRLRSLAVATSAVILLQLILGAAFRHNAFGVIPHLIGAVIVTAMILWTGLVVRARFRSVQPLRRTNKWLQALLGIQLLLGGSAYWAILAARAVPQPLPLYVVLTVAHVAVGALTLAASVLLVLCSYRLLKPIGALGLASRPQRAEARQA